MSPVVVQNIQILDSVATRFESIVLSDPTALLAYAFCGYMVLMGFALRMGWSAVGFLWYKLLPLLDSLLDRLFPPKRDKRDESSAADKDE